MIRSLLLGAALLAPALALAQASPAAPPPGAAPGPAVATPTAAAMTAPALAAQSARYVAANCANCHGTTGNALGNMPSIAATDRAQLVEQLKAFRDGKRSATIMHQLAKGYTDAQIELAADYYSRQTRVAR